MSLGNKLTHAFRRTQSGERSLYTKVREWEAPSKDADVAVSVDPETALIFPVETERNG